MSRRFFAGIGGLKLFSCHAPRLLWRRFAQTGNSSGRAEQYSMENLSVPLSPFAGDALRPRCHFLPSANWMNDPNGPIFWQGQFHLFYQYNPNGAFWGSMHWGHAVSENLTDWTHLPMALFPDKPYDKDGVYSGNAVDDHGVPTILYTGTQPEVQCLAISRDNLRTWEKSPANPLIAAAPDGLHLTDFRDPQVWREGEAWRMIIGSGVKDAGGAALLYGGQSLTEWKFIGLLCEGEKAETGTVWECPDFFPLGGKWVLLVSPIPLGKTLYFIGEYRENRFVPERQGVCDFGNFYAAKTFEDGAGRRIVWGWSPEARSEADYRAAGWAGCMAFPRVLTLNSSGALQITPAPEIECLRGDPIDFTPNLAGSEVDLVDVSLGACFEIETEIAGGDAAQIGLLLRLAPDGSEQTRLTYDREKQTLEIDREHSSLNPASDRSPQSGPLVLAENENLRLRVFVDGSIIEVYANDRFCLTSRVYPTLNGADWTVFAEGGAAHVISLRAWPLRPAVFTEDNETQPARNLSAA